MFQKILSITALASLIMLVFTGCSAIIHVAGSGKIVDKTYDFKDFTGVEISSAIGYEIKKADTYSVTVSTHENLVERLNVYQRGSTVYIGMKPGLYNSANTRAAVTMPQLTRLVVSGSSDGSAAGFESASDLEINLSGASDLNIGVRAGETNMDISGSSDISGTLTSTGTKIKLSGASSLDMSLKTAEATLTAEGSSDLKGDLQSENVTFRLTGASEAAFTGSAGSTTIEASGSSDMDCPDLTLQSADVELSGASSAKIHTDGKLNIDLSGGSHLDYTGNASTGKIAVSGASEVNHK